MGQLACHPWKRIQPADLACLPLAEGYTVTHRNVDLQKQKVQLKQAKVQGQEEVKVPAGAFKAWKVELTSTEGDPGVTTLWCGHRHPQGGQDARDPAPDGRRRGHHGTAELKVCATDKRPGFPAIFLGPEPGRRGNVVVPEGPLA